MKEIYHIHIPKTGGTWLDQTLLEYAGDSFIPTGFGDGVRCSQEDPSIWRGRYNSPSPLFVQGQWAMETPSPDERQKKWKNQTYKVAICRNPFDYLVSCYHWDEPSNNRVDRLRHYLPPGVASGAGDANIRHGIRSFDEYIEKYCDPDFPWHATDMIYDEQRYFLFHQMFNHRGICEMNTIIRQEELSRGTALMLRGLEYIDDVSYDQIIQSPKKNVSTRRKKDKDYRSYYSDAQREVVERKFRAELLLFGYNFDGPTDDSPFVSPQSLFYHPILPLAGKHLDPAFMKAYDTGLRESILKGRDPEPPRNDLNFNIGLVQIIRENQTIYPEVCVKMRGATVVDENGNTAEDPIVTAVNYPTNLRPIYDGWTEANKLVSQSVTNELILYDGASLLDLINNPTHPYSWKNHTPDTILGNWENLPRWDVCPLGESTAKITTAQFDAQVSQHILPSDWRLI